MREIEIFLAVFYIGTVLSIPLSEIVRRVLTERKLRELLPEATSVQRHPPFYHIDPKSIPKSAEGEAFLIYQSKAVRFTLIIMATAILILILFPVITKSL